FWCPESVLLVLGKHAFGVRKACFWCLESTLLVLADDEKRAFGIEEHAFGVFRRWIVGNFGA
ncbi:MAG: hypothetical protein MPK30_09890, partial [Gammaproteobacteria bacterium]|nr:hypothetical protein [Gammaproteobacteria bacterium]